MNLWLILALLLFLLIAGLIYWYSRVTQKYEEQLYNYDV